METLKSMPKANIYIAAAVLFALIIVFPSYYFYNQYQSAQQLVDEPQLATSQEMDALVAEISQKMRLPDGEDPTIATVADSEQLLDQPFFDKAKKGHKILIYESSNKAIIYDPLTKRIVDVAQIEQPAPPTPTSKPVGPVRIALYNSTDVNNLTHIVEDDLREQIVDFQVLTRANAQDSYSQTIVVDLIGSKAAEASLVASALDGIVGSMPAGETRPTSTISGQIIDLLAIIGTDYIAR